MPSRHRHTRAGTTGPNRPRRRSPWATGHHSTTHGYRQLVPRGQVDGAARGGRRDAWCSFDACPRDESAVPGAWPSRCPMGSPRRGCHHPGDPCRAPRHGRRWSPPEPGSVSVRPTCPSGTAAYLIAHPALQGYRIGASSGWTCPRTGWLCTGTASRCGGHRQAGGAEGPAVLDTHPPGRPPSGLDPAAGLALSPVSMTYLFVGRFLLPKVSSPGLGARGCGHVP